ncbi:porin protein [Caballeronia calidae]|uniref:Porin protein n=1 Tax=Caballeronia calidae TaxID=1777139 RepID=A0A158EI77_9BURK|nr:porin [Caballeronia calidae]SAL05597.1 porin protein [Caballeronia calidae]
MTRIKLSAIGAASALAFCATPTFAQSSVTLYGIVTTGVGWQNSQTTVGSTSGGRSATKMISGIWAGSRFGLKGAEDLGGGTKALFVLEEGFSSVNGNMSYSNLMFGRQAWVGVTNSTYGTVSAGRQYTSYYSLLGPYGPTTWLTGYYGAHPGDIDGLDTSFRTNNMLVYTSPSFNGLTVSGSYALGGVPGSINRGSTISAAIQYLQGPIALAAGYQRTNNSTVGGGDYGAESTANSAGQPAVSALTNGYRLAQAQQRIAVVGDYKFNEAWEVSASYSNVQYVPGVNSKFSDEAIFNTVGAVLHFKPGPAWDLAGGYSYTRATQANGITNSAQYHQVTLSQYYSLSKRTGLYAVEAVQRANGQTLGTNQNVINATASIGDGMNSTPASCRTQVAAGVGIIHKF